MNRYKITIEYDGTNFYGWQKQQNLQTIQGEIEIALEKIFQKNIKIFGSGRTDAGVHALGQIAHFDVETKMIQEQISYAINHFLQHKPISIINCTQVATDFHSRFSAKMRHYKYQIINRKAKLAINNKQFWHIPNDLKIEKMQQAAEFLIGKHDFSSFRDASCQGNNPVKTMANLKIKKSGEIIEINASATSFLHHMVRNIVGTLILVGREKIEPEEMQKILALKQRTKSGPNAPPHGLFFIGVDY
ncbi:tRNA pseudouridine(38-40) synthase TruA [Flavobacteriaceae bacterium]|nr:tRNA pseudouridine(38-40) synthase TruA [Flavobacteriaceae bacterium]